MLLIKLVAVCLLQSRSRCYSIASKLLRRQLEAVRSRAEIRDSDREVPNFSSP